jgi:hypothetical protein
MYLLKRHAHTILRNPSYLFPINAYLLSSAGPSRGISL